MGGGGGGGGGGGVQASRVGIISTPDHAHWTMGGAPQFVVLASDGVWDQMTPNEVTALIADTHRCGPAACQALVLECAARYDPRSLLLSLALSPPLCLALVY
jgi:hypothetical protein